MTVFLPSRQIDVERMTQVMLDNEMILSMLKHVVAGLSFLHSAEPPIIHQELRSVKILLDSSCRAHLTDFQQEVVSTSCTFLLQLHLCNTPTVKNDFPLCSACALV